MARYITSKYPGKCADCGASLPVGSRVRWYRGGKVYGTTCHAQAPRGGKRVWYGGAQVPASQTATGMCEDAPCCGCCGPGSDDPAYQPYEPDEVAF